MSRPLKICLTGGIGSGKTTVSDLFAKFAIPIIDADILARQLVAPGTLGLQQIVHVFGADLLQPDGSLDRKRLAQQIFTDSRQRKNLEAILHPLIYTAIDTAYQQLSIHISYCIVVVPLLVETSTMAQFDRIVLVDTNEALQLQRAMARTGITQEQACAIIKQQASRAERLQHADDVIQNDSDMATLMAQVEALHTFYLQLNYS